MTPPRIPILPTGVSITPAYVAALNTAIQSDGCTGVPDFHKVCCILHDLSYRYGIDYLGQPVDRRTADANFRKCIQADSRFGRFDPMSYYRWLGVRIFGATRFHPSAAFDTVTYV